MDQTISKYINIYLMKEIVTLPATEDLLKKYILKLYSRKHHVGDLCFDEAKMNALTVYKSYKVLTSSELLDCCFISVRGGNENFEQFIPSKFYCLTENVKNADNNEDYPFLYTSIEPLDRLPLYKADFGLNGLGSDIIDGKGNILISLYPNLYDNGFIEVSVTPDKSILVFNYDENNAESFELFIYNDVENKLIRKHEIEDKNLVLSIINEKGYATILSLASVELKDNKDLVLTALKRDPYCYIYVGEGIKNDRDVILTAIRSNPDAISHAPENIQNDKAFLLNCIEINADVGKFIPADLQNDREFVILAVSCNGSFLKYASESLKNDREIVLAAVKKHGNSLQFASKELCDDNDIVSCAINNAGRAVLNYASERICTDKMYEKKPNNINIDLDNDFDAENLPF